MDIREVEQILDNLKWLRNKMPEALANWQATKPNCIFYTGMLKEICNYPGKLNSSIFDPLIKWLYDYILVRESKMAFAGTNGLDNFLRRGLRIISNYVIVVDFFSKNTDFFAPSPKITAETLSAFTETAKIQTQYKEFINTLSSKLIGCNEKLGFVFLSLTKTIQYLPDDLKKMQDYLERQCFSLRVKAI